MLPRFQKLAKNKRVVRVEFHACMHGSEIDKRTALLTNMQELQAMAKDCDGQHPHRKWGVNLGPHWSFATADTCEYPKQMCKTMADLARQACHIPPPDAPRRRRQQ